ncbi:hypothetical protein PV682_34590 [Streptomyces niveiscabiei]|uniref:NucA/NucB deoxyribonuclease domain-containing protein n=1 Tax=Streptomyces niveiscabiei TaxID=164115 RepID=UPI0029BD1EEC|nr:hypothetical protein [Streptomyces niveiscabiei]MDX3386539.1 hypothetical protein [Streptomyces niveiscabiei]
MRLIPEITAGSDQPASKAGSNRISDSVESCTAPDENGHGICIERSTLSGLPPLPGSETDQPLAGVAPPQWCEDAQNRLLATRTQACRIDALVYRTWKEQNGTKTQTGGVEIIVINYSYGSTSESRIAHQVDITAPKGWGAALSGSYIGSARDGGACTKESGSFPTKPIQPLNKWHTGEAFFASAATAPGARGECITGWSLTFSTPGYPSAHYVDPAIGEFRCDNDTAGRTKPGCVVPWYASALQYSAAVNPELASHVSRAQASGLPGGTFEAPLTRTTDATVINNNRTKACGDAPSVTGKSCDEYPVATSYQGLSAGGTRRSFNGCGLNNIPTQQGPNGVSICMINASENDSQGGLNSGFYRSERVLDKDPFRVLVTP